MIPNGGCDLRFAIDQGILPWQPIFFVAKSVGAYISLPNLYSKHWHSETD